MFYHSKKTLQITVLVVLFAIVLGSGNSYRRPTKVTTNCCKQVSGRRIMFNVTHYTIQNGMPPCVEAVIFYTSEIGAICSNPTLLWVARKIKMIENKIAAARGNDRAIAD
uniref:Small inducible cytokine n=1 Tax=Callorhinchus milii TaxID=7868 RepID=K4G894_CALMI|nr:small inducible cytokine [Callorhinchus milii]